jgi:hypothetical protein
VSAHHRHVAGMVAHAVFGGAHSKSYPEISGIRMLSQNAICCLMDFDSFVS